MNSIDDYVRWFLMMLPLICSPGPANLMVVKVSGTGKNPGPFIGGLMVSLVVWAVLIGLGVGTLFVDYPRVFKVIELFGIGYILYLAYAMFRADLSKEKNFTPSFYQGLTLQALNPKLILALSAMYSQFLEVRDNMYWEVAYLTILESVCALLNYIAWAKFGAWLERRPGSKSLRSAVFSGSLAAVGIYMLVHAF